MRQLHDKDNSQPQQPYRWEDLEEEFRASARAYNEICNELRMDFHLAQQEAYESYRAWEAETGAGNEAPK